MAGYSFLPAAGDYHAFAYRSQTDELIDLGKHVQSCSSVGFAVNDILRVAGMNFVDPTPSAGLRWLALWDLTPNDAPMGGQLPSVEDVEGDPVTFTAVGVTDPNGDALTYTWTFSDGTELSGTLVSKRFPESGAQTATITVTNEDGVSTSQTLNIRVVEQRPSGGVLPLGEPLSGVPFAVRFFFGDFSDTTTMHVGWGDGSPVEIHQCSVSPGCDSTFTHTYVETTRRLITARFVDDDSATAR